MGIIYLLTNSISGKYYVGQTIQPIRKRLNYHFCGPGACPLLSKAIKKYGKSTFVAEILAETADAKELNQLEILWISISNSASREVGYNILSGGRGGPSGCKRPPEVGIKISAAQTERWRNHKANVLTGTEAPYPTPWNKGRKCTPEEVARIIDSFKGRRPSSESNKRRSATLKGRMPAVNLRRLDKVAKFLTPQ